MKFAFKFLANVTNVIPIKKQFPKNLKNSLKLNVSIASTSFKPAENEFNEESMMGFKFPPRCTHKINSTLNFSLQFSSH